MSAATTAPVELRDGELAGWHEWARPWPVAIAALLAAGLTAAAHRRARACSSVQRGSRSSPATAWSRSRASACSGADGVHRASSASSCCWWLPRSPSWRCRGRSWSLGFSIGVLFDPVSAPARVVSPAQLSGREVDARRDVRCSPWRCRRSWSASCRGSSSRRRSAEGRSWRAARRSARRTR